MKRPWLLLMTLGVTLGAAAGGRCEAQQLVEADEKIEFNRNIRPILSDKCFSCHGPDKRQRQGDLRLDEREAAIMSQAIVPGKPEISGVVARIRSAGPDEIMPPADSKKRLTPKEKELLRRWIADGAQYQGHWAYLPPARPAVPRDRAAIDYLVEQRLQGVGLRPAPEADCRTLVRRLSFDLLGLPPRPEEVDAFAADTSADAYEKLVERFLTSPHYGERMAIGWLDIVRFADTIGYHSDAPRNVWPYRDYVIKAFNTNMPFDRFTIEQLAGDLLPNPTRDQRVASCFNRLLLTTAEGGAQAKDYEARMLGDRVRAVGAVWLGQTFGCCQCHDHKFDPATARDFYSLGAFFADIQELPVGPREDGMMLPDEKQAAELARLTQVVGERQKELSNPGPEVLTAQQEWESSVLKELKRRSPWTVLRPEHVESNAGLKFQIEADGSVFVDGKPHGAKDIYRVTIQHVPSDVSGLRLEVLAHQQLTGQGPGRSGDGSFVLNEISVACGEKGPLKLNRSTATFAAPGFSAVCAIDGDNDPTKGWSTLGALGTNQSLDLEIAPQPQTTPSAGKTASAEMTLIITLSQMAGNDQVLGHFRILATTQPRPLSEPAVALPPAALLDVLISDPAKRSPADRAKLTDYYLRGAPAMAALRFRLSEAQRAVSDYEQLLPKCLVSIPVHPHDVRILSRGNWQDESGEIVEPALPQYLVQPKHGSTTRMTRLDLARWVVSRDNPLTARVIMNRLWKQLFGNGLSKTLEDLGSQGEPPSNAELLDWLACEFMDSGWDMKHMIRMIVASRTYRQTSLSSKELLVRDPENRWLARQGRFRLDAELVRDNALSIAGLLVLKIGGPSVKPYQPDGYWENLNYPARDYRADQNEDQYRRGLYIWWQRSYLHPSLLAFDAPPREQCVAERTRSNIPQQALVLLNDPSYVEAARAFAQRMLAEAPSATDARIAWMYWQALQRAPQSDELSALRSLVVKLQNEYASNEAAARELVHVGLAPTPQQLVVAELAAWTNAARVLLNLHETITRN